MAKKPMKPRRMSCFLANRSLYLSRASMTALMSTSLKVVSSAALSCALFNRLAMVWRMRVILTRSSPRAPPVATGAAAAAGAGAGAGVAGPLAFASAAASTSSLVRRPSLPVPLMVEGSTPCSSTARRTAGDMVCAGVSSSSEAAAGAGVSALAAAGAGAGALAPSSMIAITAPTSTVSPTATTCCDITPATGEGTSTATLSVSRLAIGSSTATASPGCLSHSAIVPSVTDSPRTGTLISVAMGMGS